MADEFKIPRCHICYKECKNQLGVKTHLLMMHGCGYHCEICGKLFIKERCLVKHKIVKHPDEFSKNSFWHKKKCEKPYLGINSQNAYKRLDDVDNSFICNICGHEYVKRTTFDRHMMRHKKSPFKCDQCYRIFKTKDKLEKHVRTVHDHCSKCDICDKYVPTISLRTHRKTHGVNYLLHKCEICAKVFGHNSSLRSHVETFHSEQTCEYCKKKISIRKMKNHLKLYHEKEMAAAAQPVVVTKKNPNECEKCGKKFKKSKHLQVHMRIHSGEKLYQCDACGRSFMKKRMFKWHKKIHEYQFQS